MLARQQLREQETKPVLKAFEAWLTTVRLTVAPGSGTAKALDYTIRRWPALIRYADSGSFAIDNNPVENSIRPIAIGKKTGFTLARSVPAGALPPYNPCSALPGSMVLIPPPG